MSDSPKRSTAQIRAARQREIAAARQRQAEMERARRAEEAARRQRERLHQVQASLRAQLERSAEAVGNVGNSPFADAASVRQIADEVRQIEQQLRSATDERTVNQLQKQLGKVQGRLKKADSASRSAAKRQRALRKEAASYKKGPKTLDGQRPYAKRLDNIITSLDRAASQAQLSHIEADWSKLRTEMKRFTAECDALERSVGRISSKLNDIRKKWKRFAGSQSAMFVLPDSIAAINSQFDELSRQIEELSGSSEVPALERTLTKLSGDASDTIAAAEAIAVQVERVRKTLTGLKSRADSLSGRVVRRFVNEQALDQVCTTLSEILTTLNDNRVGSRLDSCVATLSKVESTLVQLESESKEARQFAGQVEKQFDSLVRERQRFSKSASVQFAGEEIDIIDSKINAIETEFEAATTIDALRSALEQISSAEAKLSEVVNNAEEAQLEHDIQNQQSVLASLRDALSEVDSDSAEKFDREGSQRAAGGLERAATLLESRQLKQAVKEIVAASRLVNQHVKTVADRRAAYEAARDNAQRLIGEGNRRIAELPEESTDQRLASELRSIEGHLRQAASHFDHEEFNKAENTAATALGELDLLTDLIREWARHDEVDAELSSLDRDLCAQHDANGYQSTRQHLSAAAKLLRQHSVPEAGSEINAARKALTEHQQRLETHLAKWRADRQNADTSLQSVRHCLEGLINDTTLACHVSEDLHVLRNKETRLAERFDQHHFEAVQREAEGLVEQITNTTTIAQALAQIASEEERLGQEFDSSRSKQFDANGYQNISRQVTTLREAIRRRQVADLDKELERLRTLIDQHIVLVSEQLAEWNEQRAEAEALIGAAADQINAMAADEGLMRWARPDIESLTDRLAQISRMADEGKFDRIKDEVADCTQTVSNILEAVEGVQLKEEQRKYIVEGIEGVLRDMGFEVEDGYPSPEDSGNPFSATILRAQQVNGRSISVSIPQERDEEVWYEVEGFDMNVDSHEGQLIRTCDGAAAQLTQLHEQLRELGIEMSELWWDGKPDDEWKAADTLPRTEASSRSQPKE